jgi:hypothetical protein
VDHVRALENGDRVGIGMGAPRMDQAHLLTAETEGYFVVVAQLRGVAGPPRRRPIGCIEKLPYVPMTDNDRALVEELAVYASMIRMRVRVNQETNPRVRQGRKGGALLAEHLRVPGIDE